VSNVIALFAAVIPVGDDPSPSQAMSDGSIVIPLSVATLILGSLLPIVTAALTKWTSGKAVKAVIAIAVALIATILRRSVDGGTDLALDWALIGEFFQTFIVQVAAYLGFWEPVANINALLFPRFGIGPAAPEERAAA
jgi:glycerol-3-phosphate acyltransferase PlsY